MNESDSSRPGPSQASSAISRGVLLALAAAAAFGLVTPIIASAGRTVGPLTTAALLYAGAAAIAAVGGAIWGGSGPAPTRLQVPRLVGVALLGSVLAPTFLAWGLQRTGPTAASLVLNLEAAFSVLFARVVFTETLGPRVVLAVVSMLVGGTLVALDSAGGETVHLAGIVAVAVATVCWAADNTLTKPLADFDPNAIVAAKGALGAGATALLAVSFGEPKPQLGPAVTLVLCGATGYGLSLRLYLLAQRRMGAARTASIFATGPFLGAAASWLLGDRGAGWSTLAGAFAFSVGVYLHATERHSHPHRHEAVDHEHAHRHDDGHHDHQHHPPSEGEHTHRHRHDPVEHDHEHAPDLHHDHAHPGS